MKFSIATASYPSYAYNYCNAIGANRIDALLLSISLFSDWNEEIVIVRDFSPGKFVGPSYEEVVEKWKGRFPKLNLISFEKWRNMQWAVQTAIDACEGDVVIYLADDTIITNGTLEYIKHFWRNNDTERLHCGLQRISFFDVWWVKGFERENFYKTPFLKWYEDVLSNFKMEDDKTRGRVARAYVCAGAPGVCFALTKELWHRVGGVSKDFYMFDEDLSFRVITMTDKLTYALPNPPVIHFGAGAQAPSDDVKAEQYFRTYPHKAKALEAWGKAHGEEVDQYLSNICKERLQSLPKGLVDESLEPFEHCYYIHKDKLNLLQGR